MSEMVRELASMWVVRAPMNIDSGHARMTRRTRKEIAGPSWSPAIPIPAVLPDAEGRRPRDRGRGGYLPKFRSTSCGVSTHSATKMLVSRLSLRAALRFEANTILVPSGENMGKASNVPEYVIC